MRTGSVERNQCALQRRQNTFRRGAKTFQRAPLDLYAQLEAKKSIRKSSREKIAKALGIHESQLNF
ncbi:MAG: hypothetical protein LBD67_08250 [Candidatus Accumulibacter sp.]|jgi:hypothetical protein|nr:hypothetical protein [Accumulibacter sp.]